MGRRVRCTPDHPWITRDDLKLTSELTTDDWLPTASLRSGDDLEGFDLADSEVAESQPAISHARGAVARSHDIVRAGALRQTEARAASVPLRRSTLGTCRNGTHVPSEIEPDEEF